MKAIGHFKPLAIHHEAALEDLILPEPQIRDHDVLVRVHAVAVNPVDAKHRVRTSGSGGVPVVLGFDASGVVEAIGSKVTHLKVGDEVFYAGDLMRAGANSELQAVDSRVVGKKPASLNHSDAAAMPLTSLTAYEALFEQLGIDPNGSDRGRSILIIGGPGGVGSVAIQMSKIAGLKVIATASRPESAEWVRELGADLVLDRKESLPEQLASNGMELVDYVLNTASTHDYWQAMTDVTRPFGSICSIVESPVPLDVSLLMMKSLTFSYELMFTRTLFDTRDQEKQGKALSQVATWVDQGRLRATARTVFTPINAETLKQAHRLIESGQSIGKVVLTSWN